MNTLINTKINTLIDTKIPIIGNQNLGYNLVIEGHSFAADDAFESFSNSTINKSFTYTSAVAGSTMSMIESRAATLDTKKKTNYTNILLLWIGANDIQVEGDGTVFYNAMKSYIQDRVASGWKVLAYTTTPVNDSRAVMFEVERDISNGLMRSDLANLNNVYILDTDTISETLDPSNQLYFAGDVHLSPLGYWKVNDLFASKLNTLFGSESLAEVEISDDFVLTPTGDGTGISRLDIWSAEYSIITLDGNAKFYYDEAATLAESDTWVISPSITLPYPRYIKTTGGTSNLKIVRNRLTKITAWVSATNSLSISGNIAQLDGIEEIIVNGNNTLIGDVSEMTTLRVLDVTGSNTLSGSVSALTALTKLNVTGSNILSGSISSLINLVTINVTGSNTLSGSISNLTSLTILTIQGSNTVTGSIELLSSLTFVSIRGSNTVTGSINQLVNVTYFEIWGANTVSGDVSYITNGCTRIYLTACRFTEYTSGATWSNALVQIQPSVGYGYSVSNIALMLQDMNNSASGPSSKTINLTGSSSSMADTTQGGIWGDFDGETTPSALAIAYKNLTRVKLNTVSLNGIVVPGVSGDGTGFPSGFGDWYRS